MILEVVRSAKRVGPAWIYGNLTRIVESIADFTRGTAQCALKISVPLISGDWII